MPARAVRKSARTPAVRRSAKKRSLRKSRPDPRRAARKSPDGVVVGVGLATVDLLCVVPRPEERLMEMKVFSMQGGGAIGTTMATVAHLGAKARFFGRVGDDDFG